MKEYYIHLNQQEGPFTLEELRSKNISPDTPVWHEGLSDWSTRKSSGVKPRGKSHTASFYVSCATGI